MTVRPIENFFGRVNERRYEDVPMRFVHGLASLLGYDARKRKPEEFVAVKDYLPLGLRVAEDTVAAWFSSYWSGPSLWPRRSCGGAEKRFLSGPR